MKAPEKLYVDVHDNLNDSFLYGFTEKRTDNDIEYTRTDAFIEKACEWLSKNSPDYINYFISHDFEIFVEDFRKAQKGE